MLIENILVWPKPLNPRIHEPLGRGAHPAKLGLGMADGGIIHRIRPAKNLENWRINRIKRIAQLHPIAHEPKAGRYKDECEKNRCSAHYATKLLRDRLF